MTSESNGGEWLGAEMTARTVDLKLEVVVIPVSDVDAAKAFYAGLGWRLDADFGFDNGFRVVQLTPPGSGCSVQFGTKITSAPPGTAQGLYLVVSDIEPAHDELARARRTDQRRVSPGCPGRPVPTRRQRRSGRRTRAGPGELQLVCHLRRPRWQRMAAAGGHGPAAAAGIDATETVFASTADLADALRRAAAAHGEHEQRTGEADANWPDWYADYMVREQAGVEPPS